MLIRCGGCLQDFEFVTMDQLRNILACLACVCLTIAAAQTIEFESSILVAKEDLRWSIAGNLNGENPTVLSELKWKDLAGAGYAGSAWVRAERFLAFTDIRQTHTISGSVTDTDYSQDNRSNVVFHAKEDAGKGRIFQLDLMGGFEAIQSSRLDVTFLTGYGALKQDLYLTNARTQLNSSYSTSWKGPIMGTMVRYKPAERVSLSLKSKYHQIRYSAKGNWNLIEEFEHPVSFRHKAKGFGLDNDLTIAKEICPG